MQLLSFTPLIVLLIIVVATALRTKKEDVEKELLYRFVNTYMIFGGIWFAFGHLFYGEKVAESIGWPANNPFQKEVAFANLSFAIAAIYVSSTTKDLSAYKTLTVAYMAWLGGTLVVHFQDLIQKHNLSINNVLAAPLISIAVIILGSFLVLKN